MDRHDSETGVFASGSAEEIASAVIAAARDDGPEETLERRAMASSTAPYRAPLLVAHTADVR
jgi:hypothetical protein